MVRAAKVRVECQPAGLRAERLDRAKRAWEKVGWLAACAVAIGVAGYAGTPLADGLSFVKSIKQDHGTYYRLKVKLAYKGEPQDCDIVVGCNVRVINYKGGGNTYEAGLAYVALRA